MFIKGIIIGFGKIIPGVSGALMAIILGVYESIIKCLANPREFLENKKEMLPLLAGLLLSICLGSTLIKFFLDKYYNPVSALFIGMMGYGLIPLYKDVKYKGVTKLRLAASLGISLLILSFFVLDFTNSNMSEACFKELISLFLCGIVDAASSIIPGISGTALLMLMGYYDYIIGNLSNLLNVTTCISAILNLFPFILGLIFGLYAVAKIINYLIKKHEVTMKLSAFWFMLASIIILCSKTNGIIIYSPFLLLGFFISYICEKRLNSHN